MKHYWLMKTEPGDYSIDDLRHDRTTQWNGIRNYQARNILRDNIKVDDEVLIYHSSTRPTGVAGTARVIIAGYPDPTAWDKRSRYYDTKSTPDDPVWFAVDIKFTAKFRRFVTLDEIKSTPALKGIMVARRGMRLSVQPVDRKQFEIIVRLGEQGEKS
jgi:predicted RNA-binding protein with PUA-like domain